MNNIYLEKLEYNKILKNLENHCVTYIGKHLVNGLMPSNNKEEITNLLTETNEALSILYKASLPPLESITNIIEYIKILESDGALSLKAILDLTQILKISDNLKLYFSQDFIDKKDFPILEKSFNNLYSNKDIVNTIRKIVIDENTIDDNASPKLKSIRKDLKRQELNIKINLINILQKNSKYIQENIITIRNDRFVIPVKEEFRSQIKGLIHDISSTGATVFIEPLSIFELNNEINNLKIEEKIEIEKIIKDLSSLFTPIKEELSQNADIIGFLDFCFAKAKYSKKINATCPKLSTDKYFNLKNVKHPLLDQQKAVPISICIGKDFSCLIITGPNTGGKTVTLKTIRTYSSNGL